MRLLVSLALGCWLSIALAYPPFCNIQYGRPNPSHCRNILAAYTGARAERGASHFFGIAGIDKPAAGVSAPQFANKVDIPKFFGDNANSDCKGAILPTEDLLGEMSWDTSRYLPIAQVGQQINHYCVEAMGLPLSGTGGIDRIGDNENLRLILYAPKSAFENDTLEQYKDGLPISVIEEQDVTVPSSPSSGRKRKGAARGGGTGPSSARGGKAVRTRSLGGGWFLDFDTITVMESMQAASADLEAMYKMILQIAAGQIYKAAKATDSIGFHYGSYSLRLSSTQPISWTWIVNFAEDMLENVANQCGFLFDGTAYSYYWEIAAVGAALTVI